MTTSVKEVQKLMAHAKSSVGLAEGPFTGKAKRRGGRDGWKEPVAKVNLPHGFEKPMAADGDQLGGNA
jgi:hypothetical protein